MRSRFSARHMVTRAKNLIVRPEQEWAVIARDRPAALSVLCAYLFPLALLGPVAYAGSLLIAGDDALRPLPLGAAKFHVAMLALFGACSTTLLGVLMMAFVVYLVTPLYRAPRDFNAAFRVVAYAATPVWLAGIVLLAPLQRFPLLVVIIIAALMHACYLFYLGLHHVAQVPRSDAAECAAITAAGAVVLSTVAGYLGGAAGLFPHM